MCLTCTKRHPRFVLLHENCIYLSYMNMYMYFNMYLTALYMYMYCTFLRKLHIRSDTCLLSSIKLRALTRTTHIMAALWCALHVANILDRVVQCPTQVHHGINDERVIGILLLLTIQWHRNMDDNCWLLAEIRYM